MICGPSHALSLTCLLTATIAVADDSYAPSDLIAAVGGDPVYFGELNLVLVERLGADKLQQVGSEIRKATALLLVRRKLAMQSLRAAGGVALQSMIERRLTTLSAELQRRGDSLSKYAEVRMADEKSLAADLAWKVAWGQYVKTKLNEQNLRRYFEKHPDRYGESFDDLTDQGKLRSDATGALFHALVRKQHQAKIQWFIGELHPPEGVSIIPAAADGVR